MSDAQPASVYDLAHEEEAENLATFAILVDNEPGVLHRLVGLFAASFADAGALDRIRDKGEIALGYVPDAAPFSFTGADSQPQGYSVDLCR